VLSLYYQLATVWSNVTVGSSNPNFHPPGNNYVCAYIALICNPLIILFHHNCVGKHDPYISS